MEGADHRLDATAQRGFGHLTVPDLVVIGQGRLIDQGSMAEFVARYAPRVRVRVQSPQLDELSVLLRNVGAGVSESTADALPAPRPEPGQPLAPPRPAR